MLTNCQIKELEQKLTDMYFPANNLVNNISSYGKEETQRKSRKVLTYSLRLHRMDLPDVIDWQTDEVMDALACYFKQKVREGVRYVSHGRDIESVWP